MLLHPLRSELNFPIGEKFPLTPNPTRWDLPIYLLDIILKASYVAMGNSNAANDSSIQELINVFKNGIKEKRSSERHILCCLIMNFMEDR